MLSLLQDEIAQRHWGGTGLLLFALVSYIGFGAVLTKIDIQRHRLPDKIVLPMYLCVALPLLCFHWLNGDIQQMNRAGWSGIFLLGIYWLLRKLTRNSLGFGDVKLAGVLGVAMGFFSPINLLWGTFITFLSAGIVAVMLVLFRKAQMKTHIAFGPFMLLGTLVALLRPVISL